MQKLLALLLHSQRPQLKPTSVLQTARPPGFHPGHEQDSSEFLGHLLDKLHEQENTRKFENNLVTSHSQNIKEIELISDGMDIDMDDTDCDNKTGKLDDDGAQALISSIQSAGNVNNIQYGVPLRTALPKTLIQKSFGGNISITYKCLNCDTESKQFDSFRDLHLSFPDIDTATANHSVQDLLDFYCSTEKLDEDNKYYCDQCKALCDGERFINIVNAPQNLILTLKHFKYDQKYNMRAKLMHKVCHEEEIRIKVMPNNDCQEFVLHYRLYAAVVHSGVSMETGHYFTYGTDHTNWYKFDDNYVVKSTISELHNLQPPHTPYILFYQMIQSPIVSVPRPSTSATSAAHNEILSLQQRSNGTNGNNNGVLILHDYPALEDLPPLLREYVNRDNVTYCEETRSAQIASSVWSRNRKNDFFDSDDNDEPPNSCGGGQFTSYPRFIS